MTRPSRRVIVSEWYRRVPVSVGHDAHTLIERLEGVVHGCIEFGRASESEACDTVLAAVVIYVSPIRTTMHDITLLEGY